MFLPAALSFRIRLPTDSTPGSLPFHPAAARAGAIGGAAALLVLLSGCMTTTAPLHLAILPSEHTTYDGPVDLLKTGTGIPIERLETGDLGGEALAAFTDMIDSLYGPPPPPDSIRTLADWILASLQADPVDDRGPERREFERHAPKIYENIDRRLASVKEVAAHFKISTSATSEAEWRAFRTGNEAGPTRSDADTVRILKGVVAEISGLDTKIEYAINPELAKLHEQRAAAQKAIKVNTAVTATPDAAGGGYSAGPEHAGRPARARAPSLSENSDFVRQFIEKMSAQFENNTRRYAAAIGPAHDHHVEPSEEAKSAWTKLYDALRAGTTPPAEMFRLNDIFTREIARLESAAKSK
jgi:hypothetical protein